MEDLVQRLPLIRIGSLVDDRLLRAVAFCDLAGPVQKQRPVQAVQAPKTPGRATDIMWVGFTDARVGAALTQMTYDASAKTEVTALWRTTDGGATWSKVRVG